ncbi:MAG: Uma2 family endonuclease [Deltaproteobacteria bacterium]|nr:Uma2 family endonuclease [Deltaproteobacteria bacterium]
MSAVTSTAPQQVYYPESDGKPMGETDVHIDALIYLRESLKDYFRNDPHVYVAGNMLLYYEEGIPSACVAPDVFVVRGVAKHERRTYKLWEEEQPPTVIFEITSRSTRLEDLGTKRALYAMLGVQEYYLYDPLGEYLRPSFQGYRLENGEYLRLLPEAEGKFMSRALGLELRVEAGQLRAVHPGTGERLLSPMEAQAARRIAEARLREEAAQRKMAEAHAEQETARRKMAEAHAEQEIAQRQLAEVRAEQEAEQRQMAEVLAVRETAQRQMAEVHAAQESANRQAAEARATQAEVRASQAETELERLRAELARLQSLSEQR